MSSIFIGKYDIEYRHAMYILKNFTLTCDNTFFFLTYITSSFIEK